MGLEKPREVRRAMLRNMGGPRRSAKVSATKCPSRSASHAQGESGMALAVVRAPPVCTSLISIVDVDLVHQRDIDEEPTPGRIARIGMSASGSRIGTLFDAAHRRELRTSSAEAQRAMP